jgi:hypothetical protein
MRLVAMVSVLVLAAGCGPTSLPELCNESVVILGRLDPEVISRTVSAANPALLADGFSKLRFSIVGKRCCSRASSRKAMARR